MNPTFTAGKQMVTEFTNGMLGIHSKRDSTLITTSRI